MTFLKTQDNLLWKGLQHHKTLNGVTHTGLDYVTLGILTLIYSQESSGLPEKVVGKENGERRWRKFRMAETSSVRV